MEEQRLLKRKRKAANENNLTLLVAACTDLADLYVKEGRHDLAIEEYKALAKIYKSENKLIEYANAYRGIGEAYMGLHDFEKALEHQTIYLNVANEEKNKLEQQRALATIGHTYLTWYLETQADPDKNLNAAYKYFMKSLVIAETLSGLNKLEKVDMLARLFSNLGLVKECLGDFNKALELLNRSIAICKQHDIYEQLSRSYISVASLYEKREQYNDAIRHYNLAIESAKKLKDKVDLMCAALMAKSETLIKLADFHSARQILLKAYKLKTPNKFERNVIERNLRTVATMCYTEDKLLVTCDNQKELKKLYEKMGDAACDLKIYGKAIEYYKLMLECAEKSGVSGRDLASCYYNLAETYKDNGQFMEAIEYFEKEYALCTDLKDNLNTLSKIADTKEEAGFPVSEVKAVYERAFTNCRKNFNLKEERRMVTRCIGYLRRNNSHTDAFQLNQYLNTLDQPSFEDELSSSDTEDSEAKENIGDDINLNDITDDSDDSDLENQKSTSNVQNVIGKRRNKNFIIKKNPKGESQLHVACINGTEPVVRHLVETGHPINVRDHSGWLPIHEACNHGHYEIVKFLLEKGAAINDRGGTHCNGVTPLYDAANNGHLKIVKLLLDNGASAITKTDDGDTPLNVLKEWQNKYPFQGDDLVLFQSLIKRLREAMEKAGQNTKPTLLVRPSCSQRPDKENVVQRSNQYKRVSRSMDSDEDVDSENIGEFPLSQLSQDDGANEYVKVMKTLRNKTDNISGSAIRNANLVSKRPALVITEDGDNDWLEDDMQSTKAAKKRKTNSISSLITSNSTRRENNENTTQASPKKRASFEIPDNFFEDDFEDEHMFIDDIIHPNGEHRRASNESRPSISSTSSTSSNKRKTQASLLDAGFSRTRSDTPTFERNYSSESTSERNRGNSCGTPLNRTNSFEQRSKPQQQRLTDFGHTRSIVETDSTTEPAAQASVNEQARNLAPATGDLMVYVDVKVEGKVFRVPVLLSQVQSNTIGWLAEQAAIKYARKEGTKPTLELETNTGALLSDEDPLSLLFPLGAMQAEPVVGRVLELSLPPLIERYKEACSLMNTDVDTLICNLLEELSIDLNLANHGFLGKSLAPLCKALNYQNSLLELDLSGNFVDMNSIIKLCSSLPTLTNLCTLNLRCTGLTSSHLAELVKVFTATSTPMLQKLSSLDLSDNFLRDKSLLHLSQVMTHLNLTNLNLSNVRFTGNIFKETGSENVSLNLSEIQCLDLSDNELGEDDIKRFIWWTNASKLGTLNVSRNDSRNQGILGTLVDVLRDVTGDLELKSLNLSRCNVHENELYEFLRLCSRGKSLSDINLSYNPNLTGISLRRLLECSSLQNINLIGCDNIFRYFDDSIACNSLEDSDENGKKMLKISASLGDHPAQVATLISMFRSKYHDCYMEKSDNFLLLASSEKG